MQQSSHENENVGEGSSEIQDPDDDGDEGFEADLDVLTCWLARLASRCSECKSQQS